MILPGVSTLQDALLRQNLSFPYKLKLQKAKDTHWDIVIACII